MNTSYITTSDGEWIQPRRKDYRLACCDCGLVHRVEFRIKNGRIQFRAYRLNRSTGQRRRQMKNRSSK